MSQFKRLLSVGLIVAVIGNSSIAVLVAGEETTSRRETFKEKALAIASGTMVEVKLVNKEKFRGRIGGVSDHGFIVQTSEGNNIEEKTVSFDQVKSIKALQGKGRARAVGKRVAIVLADVALLPLLPFMLMAMLGSR